MLEVLMDECLINGDSHRLASLLDNEGLMDITLTRLDQVVTKRLRGPAHGNVSAAVKALQLLADKRDRLLTLVDLGVTAKVLLWFQNVCDLLTSNPQRNSGQTLSLTECFYDFFLLLSQVPLPVSQQAVVLLQLAKLTLEPDAAFTLRLEAIRTFNSILESLSREQRRQIQMDQNHIEIL